MLLAAIYYLFKEVQALKRNQPTNITAILEKYLQDIRMENDRLQELSSTHGQTQQPTQREHHTGKEPKVTSETVPTYNPELVQTEDVSETSLQARMLQMHHQGKTAKEIAQSLNCGHTEVELTLKFYEEENA